MSQPDAGAKIRIAEAYGRQPLGFEANHGQTGVGAQDVQFVSRGAGYTLFLRSTEAVLRLRNTPHELRMKLVDSNPTPRVSQENELPGKSNYIIGSDRRNWHTQVPRYGKVKYQDVYPGVDLVYYGNQQQLEYDFIVAPGADPDAIELAFEGARNIRVDAGGDLVLEAGDSEVRLKTPVIYQETDGHRVEIPGGYRKTDGDRVAFHLGAYDSTRPLVIDPILIYSTYLGGSNQDFALGIAIDPDGNAFVTGFTRSLDFPMASPAQPACAANFSNGYPDCADVFITVLTPGRGIGYSTYLGGTSRDVGTGIAVDGIAHAVYVTGLTDSRDFPTVNAVEPTFGDNPEATTRAFVFKLNGHGVPDYSTYLGGDEPSVVANAIAVDAEGAAYVTGTAGTPYDPMGNAFVTKLTPDGSAVAYSLRLGGPAVGYSIAVDAEGYASVTGATDSPGFRVNVFQPTRGRGFAAKLVPDGSALVYSTYLFGDGIGTGIALAGPYTFVTGVMPRGSGGGPTDAFVARLDFGGEGGYFRFGGSGEDRGSAIAVGTNGDIWVTGVTTSTDFPLVHPLQGQVHDIDAFVVRFRNSQPEPVFSTYLGGGGREQLISEIGSLPGPPGPALALDRFGIHGNVPGDVAWVAGFTDSTDFPTAGLVPTTQPATNGPINSFVAAFFDDGVPTKPDLAVTNHPDFPSELELGYALPYVFQVTNKGPDRAWNVWFVDKLPPGVIVGEVFVVTPSMPWLPHQTCNHDNMWVACRVAWTLSQGESVYVLINATPTTVGPQINTAAVLNDGESSHALGFWLNGWTEDLVWGEDASRDGDIRDNSLTTTTVITPGSADLSVTGSVSSDVVILNGTLTYMLDVENRGPATSTAATLTDTLPAGATLVSATQSGGFGTCGGTSVVTCQWPSLSGVARVTIVVRATTPGTMTNTAVVSGTATDPDNSNNMVTFTTRVNRPPTANAGPDQIVSAGASCQAIVTLNGTGSSDSDGDMLTYTWTTENLLPPPIVLSPGDPSSGTVTGPTPSGPLPLGAHIITLTVNDGHGGTTSDTVVVTVRDVTAPTFSGVPASVTVEQSSASGTAFTVTMPSAADNCSGSIVVSSNAPAMFPAGATTVTFTVADAAGNSATATTTVTVGDTTPPTFSGVPPAMTVEQTDPAGASVTVPMPAANDTVSGSVIVSSNAPALFSRGVTTVTFTAADAAGNSATATTTVTVVDTTPPTFSGVLPPMTVEQAGPSGTAVAVPMPTANDTASGSIAVSSNAPAMFPPGATTVTFIAADAAGNSATATTTVTVVDTTPPTFSGVPPPVTVEQASPSGTSVAVPMPVATDAVSSSVAVLSNAPAMFPRGATTVTFTAHDAAGNTATATTTVTVVDTTAPVLAIASPQAGAYLHSDVVTMSFAASDAGSGLAAGMPTARLDGAVVANGQGISLLTLALGTHSFVLTATDVAGHSWSQTVTFTVTATFDSLITSVNVFAGQKKIDDSNTVKSLLAKLNDARQAAQRGNKTVAINKLMEFIDLVRAQNGRHITVDAAQILTADAQYVIGTLR
jgi:uncharacterized repeat protein (TIGR01451 family)